MRPALVLVSLATTLLFASVASASRVTYDGSVLTYTAAPGEVNSPIVSVNAYESLCDPVPAPCLSILDSWVTISYPAGVCAGSGGDVRCPLPGSVVASLGDREDTYHDWDGDSTVDAGPGNDNTIAGNGGNDVLRGGAGSDVLLGGPGDDALDGGPGDDYLEGIAFAAEAETGGSDTYAGGGGSDRLTYEGRSDDLSLSADGVADDGAPGEGDDIGADIASIVGGHGADTIVGNALANVLEGREGDDRLHGAGGDDRLVGSSGNDHLSAGEGQDVLGGDEGDDVLDGGAGVDAFWGDDIGACIPDRCASGQDVILARDGAPERLSCGPGTDRAEVDAADDIVAELWDRCESVAGAAANEALTIPLRFTAPGRGVLSVRATARSAGKRIAVGRASRRVRRRGRVGLRLRVSPAAVRALSAAGELRVSLTATFRPRGRRAYVLARRTTTLRAS